VSTKRVKAARKAFLAWEAKYQPKSYEDTPENRAFLQSLDPKYVWTFFSDAEPQHVANGFYENSGWSFYVSSKPWEGSAGEINYDCSVRDICDQCPGDGSDCEACDGSGESVYYVD
jgi:hypothetical protein